jgi:hypothetical protein
MNSDRVWSTCSRMLRLQCMQEQVSAGNHVTVLQLVRGPTSARLGSALGRWNPVEQTGLCIYSCFRTYRLVAR